MIVFQALKRILSISLVFIVLLFGNVLVIPDAAAKSITPEAVNYTMNKGKDPVKAYRRLQQKTYAYRNEGMGGEGSQTGRIGNRVGLAERTGAKLQNRMDQRRDLTSQPSSVEDAAKNMMDNTQNAFQQAGNKVQRTLNPNR